MRIVWNPTLAQVVLDYGSSIERCTPRRPEQKGATLADCCSRQRIRHHFMRPYRPRTSGKPERFIRTLLPEWAPALPCGRSVHRTS